MVPVLENWHKGINDPYARSPVVDEEKDGAKALVKVSA